MSSESSEPEAIIAADARSQEAQPQTLFERLIDSRNRDLAFFVPFVLSSTTSHLSSTSTTAGVTDTDSPDLDQIPPRTDGTEDDTDQAPRTQTPRWDRVALVNPRTQEMLVIEGENIASFFEITSTVKNGQPPASKSSIEAMPSVETKEGEVEEQGECVICLDDWEVGRKIVKEMPCKHRFHGDCIEKWLEIHGSCPICRYKMPVEEEGEEKEVAETESVEREMLVRFLIFIRSSGDGSRDGEQMVETGEIS